MAIGWSLCAGVAALLAVAFLIILPTDNNKQQILLGVCILSARDHPKQRAAIRKTWMTLAGKGKIVAGKEIVVKFVIGEYACPINPSYRTRKFGCQEWMTGTSVVDTTEFEAFTQTNENHEALDSSSVNENINDAKLNSKNSFIGPIAESVSVSVLHSILLKRIGIHESLKLTDKPLVVSVFKDADEEEITSVEFSHANPGVLHKGYRYQPVTPTVLTTGTPIEFSIMSDVESFSILSPDIDKSVIWTNGTMYQESKTRLTRPHSVYLVSTLKQASHNIGTVAHSVQQEQGHSVLVIQGLRQDGTVIKAAGNNSLFSLISFMYSVEDVEQFMHVRAEKEKAQAAWKEMTEREQEELKEEAAKFKDILFVDSVDVYRSLPSKLLQCNKWFAEQFAAAHILKTDDDSFVALDIIRDILSSHPLENFEWWGNFRKDWTVQRVGKWQEEDYSPSVYPPFACGSGYVISRNLHSWLAANTPHLHTFQGEDVSMAIWFSPLAPKVILDRRWQCFKLCEDNLLSIPDLTSTELLEMWDRRQKCSSPCSCLKTVEGYT